MALYRNTEKIDKQSLIEDYRRKRMLGTGDVYVGANPHAKPIKHEYPDGVCECLKRPEGCVCFKEPGTMHHSDGTTERYWHTPPPSPILKHYDNIKEWGITNNDKVYIKRLSDGKRIESKKKITEYAYPHCHDKECRQLPSDMYYDMIQRRFGKPLPEPYAEEMTVVENDA